MTTGGSASRCRRISTASNAAREYTRPSSLGIGVEPRYGWNRREKMVASLRWVDRYPISLSAIRDNAGEVALQTARCAQLARGDA